MTLKEFEDVLKKTTEAFVQDWERNAKDFPNEYPTEMAEGDWWEQFIAQEF